MNDPRGHSYPAGKESCLLPLPVLGAEGELATVQSFGSMRARQNFVVTRYRGWTNTAGACLPVGVLVSISLCSIAVCSWQPARGETGSHLTQEFRA